MHTYLPTFIVIGPGRAGTSWMYEVLRQHPDVGTARGTKETLFFDREYYRGSEWYKQFFKDYDNYKARGEISNAYIYNPLVPSRIKSLLPDITLIACFRNPFERIQSVYLYRKQRGIISMGFAQAIGTYNDLIYNNFYWTQLKWFLAFFDSNKIKIMFYDDLCQNPKDFIRKLYTNIGASPNFVPDVVDKRINPGAKPNNPIIGKLSGTTANFLRSTGFHSLLDYLKRSDLVRSMAVKELKKEEKAILSDEVRRELLKVFKPEIEALAKYTGRDLSHWIKESILN